LINTEQGSIIVKIFNPSNKDGMKKEIQFLSMLPSTIHAPKLYQIDHKNNLITMEYINGSNLCDLLHDHSISNVEKTRSLTKWHNGFQTFITIPKTVLLFF
jgi:predicted Ser/Thr protein kinase